MTRRTVVQPTSTSLFARANPFVDLVWSCDESGLCMSFGCGECGALAFRRRLAELDRAAAADHPSPLAHALATVDFALLRLAPHWYDALDIALFELRSRPVAEDAPHPLGTVLEAWLHRDDLPVRVLDLVMFRHARYSHPTEALAELWIQRCLQTAASTEDEGLVETLILGCPERVRAHAAAHRAALAAARRSHCVRSVIDRVA
ncbi:MAG: hypothetical protein U0636_09065 [Phycisphaerales bacterium]